MTRVGKRFCNLLFLSVAFSTPLTFAASALNLPLDARLRVFEAWVMNLMEERSLPSISLAVVSGQELVYARAFGFADLEEELADEAPLESALSLTASGEDRFTAPTAQGFYAGELTVEFVRNSDGCIQALRLNRELLPRR